MVNGLLLQLSNQLNFVGSTYREAKEAKINYINMHSLSNLEPAVKVKQLMWVLNSK